MKVSTFLIYHYYLDIVKVFLICHSYLDIVKVLTVVRINLLAKILVMTISKFHALKLVIWLIFMEKKGPLRILSFVGERNNRLGGKGEVFVVRYGMVHDIRAFL